jgi:uncharacterized protein (DUF1015 family)
MPQVRPFTGLLYDPAVSGPFESVTAPPYDVISPIDQERYHRANPYNVVRLILGHEEPGDGPTNNKYTRARAFLRAWRDAGALRPTARPCVFPYEFRFHLGGRDRRLRGIIAEVELEPWGGSIIPHERTLPGPIEDRLALLSAVQANLSPVYGVFEGPSRPLAAFLDAATRPEPARAVTDDAGTEHRLWVCHDGTEPVTEALSRDRIMIADGHHRYTVALAYRERMRATVGHGRWDGIMMLLADAAVEDPPVLPIHRLVAGQEPPQLPDGIPVRDMAEVLASLGDDEMTVGSVRKEDGALIHRVHRLQGNPPAVCALHDQVLDRLQASDIRFVPDAVVAEEAVRAGRAAAAYLLPPTRVERVRAVIASGGKLPQKSTYFWPKPRTGMVIRPFEP